MVDKLMIEDTDSFVKFSPCEYQLNLKQHDIAKFYDKYPNRNIILCKYSKLNTIKDGYYFNKC